MLPTYHHQPQFFESAPSAAPHAGASLSFDQMIKQRYTHNDSRLRDAISRARFPNPEARRQCSYFVDYLRIHRNLFFHTYVHLSSCCKGRQLHLLVDNASIWRGWGSVQQLTHRTLIRDKLLKFWADRPCHDHKFLVAQQFVIGDDDDDLLTHLLYCGKKPELFELSDKPGHDYHLNESEQVIELLWQFLMRYQEKNVARRLRAMIYRMARKSAYLPHALRIAHPSISNEREVSAGAHGIVTMATMNGRNIAIKKILCGDHAAQKKCLEMFASEAILWKTLQHKNIVPFLGVIAEGTFDIGLVSAFFKNGSIKHHMNIYKPKDWPALARRWGGDLASALDYLHCHEPPIIHGDLKGDNVLVDDAGHACLGDFGQSHASDSGKYIDSTRVGLAMYSPVHWMAPEIMLGGERAKATDKSDIYSFGCVLYEMFSGKIPFEGLSFGYVVKSVKNGGRPDRPESISRDDPLWNVAKSCWRKIPDERPSTTILVSLLR